MPTGSAAMEKDLYRSVVIAGGGGMLGHSLAEALGRRGVRSVRCGHDECDITDGGALRRLFDLHCPTLLFNCAAYTKVDQAEQEPRLAAAVNGDAVASLAAQAAEHGTKLVHYSTDFVFDGRSPRPYRPDDPVNPLSAYGRSKLLGERRLQERNPPGWLLIRTAWLFGTSGPCFPRAILQRARADQPLKVVNDQTGSPTFTDDLADASLELIDHDAAGIWHLTNSGSTTWFDFARAILREFGLPEQVQPCTAAEWAQIRPNSAIRPAYSVLDTTAYRELTGRSPSSWQDALRRYHRVIAAIPPAPLPQHPSAGESFSR